MLPRSPAVGAGRASTVMPYARQVAPVLAVGEEALRQRAARSKYPKGVSSPSAGTEPAHFIMPVRMTAKASAAINVGTSSSGCIAPRSATKPAKRT